MKGNIGLKFRLIRKNKDYSQHFMADGILTQSSYSKFELGKTEISFASFIKLLEKLEMSHEEFDYINNDYKYSDHENLLIKFFNLPYNDPVQLNNIITTSKRLLENEHSVLISDIVVICKALIILNRTNDIELARKEVAAVWSRLDKRNYWYLSEIKMINTILFLFPSAAAKEMTNKALGNLKKYENFRNANKLVGNLKLNLSLLLLEEKEYREALQVIEEVLIIFKQHSMYKQLAAAYVRKGICLSWLTEYDGEKEIEKGILMLEFLEDTTLRDVLINETKKYCKFYK